MAYKVVVRPAAQRQLGKLDDGCYIVADDHGRDTSRNAFVECASLGNHLLKVLACVDVFAGFGEGIGCRGDVLSADRCPSCSTERF